MKQSITFVHPHLYNRTDVRVGPDHLLMLVGVMAGLVRLADAAGGLQFGWGWYAAAGVLAHARQVRHLRTWPVLASVLLAAMSFGMSGLLTGIVINRMVAQRYRDAGWKIRNTDGEIGEYSSRFLAVDRLGFHESDLMEEVVRTHLDVGLIGSDAPEAPAPASSPARPALARVRTAKPTATSPAG
ncbi:MAG: hypothetical protein RL456_3649 [Pseudomonadota bacterium]|jgi:hypothetical protein